MRPYQICSRCVMDTSDTDILFDSKGTCNHCNAKIERLKKLEQTERYSPDAMRRAVQSIRAERKGEKYDCIMGVSGGVDSSYLCHILSKLQLRPLLMHFDNGWNTPFSEQNIQKIIDKLKFDYVVYKVNEQEFFELQKAYFKAGVIDIEALTDQGLSAALYQKAEEFGIKHVISGVNYATEYIMGSNWNYNKQDIINIYDICNTYAHGVLNTYPLYDHSTVANKFIQLDLLNYIKYNSGAAIKLLEDMYAWQRYPGKHYESYFTKFYQAYILPRKFGVDKRRAHLSDMIVSDEISRAKALKELQKPLYTPEELEVEKAFVLHKIGLRAEEFEAIMAAPPVSHFAYAHI